MQSYDHFKAQVLERFSAAFPDAEVEIRPVTKNNHTVLDGLVVMQPGSNISPTVYLDQIYGIYRESGDFERIWRDLYAVYDRYRKSGSIDLDFLTDFDRARPHLFCRLISAARNTELLKNIPYRMFLDLAIVYYIGFPQENETCASILVTNTQLEDWGVTEDELQRIAHANNRAVFPAELISLSGFLMQENPCLTKEDEAVPLYILTNSAKIYGASALLDEDMLVRFAEEAGDFYILPSSLHEVLLISKENAPKADVLNEIIRDVNQNHLNPEDILSDHLYTYSQKSRSIS